jgi:hypothetical protein
MSNAKFLMLNLQVFSECMGHEFSGRLEMMIIKHRSFCPVRLGLQVRITTVRAYMILDQAFTGNSILGKH